MAGEKNFLLRLPPELYAAIEAWAREERRSVNSQIVWLVDRSLREAGREPDSRRADGQNDALQPDASR